MTITHTANSTSFRLTYVYGPTKHNRKEDSSQRFWLTSLRSALDGLPMATSIKFIGCKIRTNDLVTGST
jgi:hypothetical protein